MRLVKIAPTYLSPGRTHRSSENCLEQLHLRGIGDRPHLEPVAEHRASQQGQPRVGTLVDALIAHGLAQPTDFLATAELGNEVA